MSSRCAMLAIAASLVAGCGPPATGAVGAGVVAPGAPTLGQLRSATVAGVLEAPVRLSGGRYDGPPGRPGEASHPTLVLVESAMAAGDVDGAPGPEAVALLSSSAGGSGTFVWLAVFGLRGGHAESLAVTLLGDRVQWRDLRVDQGRILLELVEPGPADPACCPTQVAHRSFVLTPRGLEPG